MLPPPPRCLPGRAAQVNIAGLFAQQVARAPDRIALQSGDRQWSYRSLQERTDRLANALAAQGVVAGDRIAVVSENRVAYVELQLAAAKLGVVLACQNWRQADGELEHCIRLVTPKLLFHSGRFAPVVDRIAHGVPRCIDVDRDYEALLADVPADAPTTEVDPEAGLIILYTSGTTGMPKGALISQRAMIARSMVSRVDSSLQAGDTFIAWAPMFHMVSSDSVYGTLLHGGKVILMDGLDVAQLVQISSQEFIGQLILMPGMIDRVIDEIERSGRKPAGARMIGCMADLVPPTQIARITTLYQAPYRNTFGSTETGGTPASAGLVAIGFAPQRLSKTQNSLCQIRLVDENDVDVADGEPGELALRSPTLFSGYWAADEANAEAFRNGWYHMGDVFVRNPDGTLDFVDRRKYLIKSGGENIYPAEIERVLMGDARVLEAAVVRRPDARWGEVPVAFVARADRSLSADELTAHCRGKIAGYKLPKEVIFIGLDEFPRSATGKVMRHELERRLAASGTPG